MLCCFYEYRFHSCVLSSSSSAVRLTIPFFIRIISFSIYVSYGFKYGNVFVISLSVPSMGFLFRMQQITHPFVWFKTIHLSSLCGFCSDDECGNLCSIQILLYVFWNFCNLYVLKIFFLKLILLLDGIFYDFSFNLLLFLEVDVLCLRLDCDILL